MCNIHSSNFKKILETEIGSLKDARKDATSPNPQVPFPDSHIEKIPDNPEDVIPLHEPIRIFPKISDDPAEWIANDLTRDTILRRGIKQNLEADFSQTKRQYSDRMRCLSQSVFNRTLANGQSQTRSWLVFSQSKSALFCAPCKLFGKTSLLTEGYNDWKNVHKRLKEHENSFEHRSAATLLLERSRVEGKVNKALLIQTEKEIDYWRNILKRVVAVIRSLAIRGLALRGSNERFFNNLNGNYMMCLELIAEFDPLLAEHIRVYGNKGSGSTSYLSATICDEFVQLLATQVMRKILLEVKSAKYFSVSVDSTPDISHVDQLTFIIRYVSKDGHPTERF